ncbi:M15 family metallopeptidase [Cellulomonas sp. NPDC089187]|uniref:M15 family metallopeptidase n=1 Tax=Cellulomonas sp. NPDC089187 TaxID=3154970 RepID=UPI00341D7EC0
MPSPMTDERRSPTPAPATARSTLRITRRGRLALSGLALVALVLLIALTVSLLRPSEVTTAGPAATVDPACVPTTETSQNCWPAITEGDDDRMEPSQWVTGRLLAGDVHTVLEYVAARFDAEVEPVNPDSSWGWAYRSVRGEGGDAGELSNHASGTSIDLNATEHPLGESDTFTPAQVDAIHAILAEVAPVVAWGGDFEGRADEMHFEIVGDPAAVAEVAARLRAG